MQSHASVLEANCLPLRPRFFPGFAQPERLAEQWDENGRSHSPVTPQARHDCLRVLIVNDDLQSAAGLKRVLLALGFPETLVAYSGKRALAAVSDYSPAVAIVDLDLSDMTGYSLARSLRSHTAIAVRQIPLIAVAEHSKFGLGELARAAGFVGLLSKPVPSWLLHSLLMRSLT